MSKATNTYSPEVRERAVRMVLDDEGQHESPLDGDPVDFLKGRLCGADARLHGISPDEANGDRRQRPRG